MRWLILLSIGLCAVDASAARREIITGPVEAVVVGVQDGDTLRAEAKVWPGHRVNVLLRIRGIDAPEMRSRCGTERMAAERARAALAAMVAGGPVHISNISGEKYFGRVLADVTTADGIDVAPLLLERDLVRPYGGKARQPWC